jgi:hypothetical protein
MTARVAAIVWALAVAWLAGPAAAAPVTCRIGAYVTSIHNVDTVAGTFQADAWTWSLCPGAVRDALATIEATNADAVATALHTVVPRGRLRWEQQKLSGTFRDDFDVRLYPFDRHRLVIALEEGRSDTRELVYAFDRQNSGVSERIRVPGWTVGGFGAAVSEAETRTNFGDPSLPPGSAARYAHLDLSVGLSRSDVGTFVKLTFPVYVAALLALLGLLLHGEGRSLLNARLGLLSGLLFAIVLNLRSTDEVVGTAPSLTLMDLIHFAALALVFATTAAAAVMAVDRDEGEAATARRRRLDRRFLVWGGGLYLAANAALIGGALALR